MPDDDILWSLISTQQRGGSTDSAAVHWKAVLSDWMGLQYTDGYSAQVNRCVSHKALIPASS